MNKIAISVAVVLILPASALAVSTSNIPEMKVSIPRPVGSPAGREGGETMADAVLIPALPYGDTASTVGHINDYDEACPWLGSSSPDVVYKYVPASDHFLTVDLCESLYDTKVYIFQDVVYNTVACSDDAGCGYSGYQSKLDHIPIQAGHDYYIVVDGYGGDAGTYVMTVTAPTCDIPCPPGALIEGEPLCGTNYVDHYNGGCNSAPFVFQDVPPAAPGGTIALCGESGTYLYNGLSYRDTDWFQLTLVEAQTITFCCTAYFPLLIILIYNADCGNILYDSATAWICQEACLSRSVGPGLVWLWVGPSVFGGVPCGADYVMTIDGYETTSPVESRSWGAVKALYR